MKSLTVFLMAILFVIPSFAVVSPEILNLQYDSIMRRALPELKDVDWKVGDYQIRRVKKGFLKVATVKSWVDRNQGDALWLINEVSIILKGKEVHEGLIDRKTGKILEYYVDGEEQDPPDITQLEECEDIGEAAEKVKVPAGEYNTTRTIVRCPKETVAIWVADKGVNMNGHVRQAVLTKDEDPEKFDYLVELTEFGNK